MTRQPPRYNSPSNRYGFGELLISLCQHGPAHFPKSSTRHKWQATKLKSLVRRVTASTRLARLKLRGAAKIELRKRSSALCVRGTFWANRFAGATGSQLAAQHIAHYRISRRERALRRRSRCAESDASLRKSELEVLAPCRRAPSNTQIHFHFPRLATCFVRFSRVLVALSQSVRLKPCLRSTLPRSYTLYISLDRTSA